MRNTSLLVIISAILTSTVLAQSNENLWDSRFRACGVYAQQVVEDGDSLYIRGGMYHDSRMTAQPLLWDGIEWSSLNAVSEGNNRRVYKLLLHGDDLFMMGMFDTLDDGTVAKNIARWSKTDQKWYPLGEGLPGLIAETDMVADNRHLYVLGYTHTAPRAWGVIMQWSFAQQSWKKIATISNNKYQNTPEPRQLMLKGDSLFVIGMFDTVNNVRAHNIAFYHINDAVWHPFGDSLTGSKFGWENRLRSIVAGNGDTLYVSGSFLTDGKQTLRNIALWDGAGWKPVGQGVYNGESYSGAVLSMHNGVLHAYGEIRTPLPDSAVRFIRWDGTLWTTVDSLLSAQKWDWSTEGEFFTQYVQQRIFVGAPREMHGSGSPVMGGWWNGKYLIDIDSGKGCNGVKRISISQGGIRALYPHGTDLYAGGEFTRVGGKPVGGLASWNGTDWTVLLPPELPLPITLRAMCMYRNELYLGGYITELSDTLWYALAKLKGGRLLPLVPFPEYKFHYQIRALIEYKGNLIAAGYFKDFAQPTINYIAQWNGEEWTPLGSGIADPDTIPNDNYDLLHWGVHTLHIYNDELYVGGIFRNAGGKDVNGLAKWNGSTWDTVGYLGGDGTTDFRHNDAWVRSLTSNKRGLYIIGNFDSAGYERANDVACYDGNSMRGLTDTLFKNARLGAGFHRHLFLVGGAQGNQPIRLRDEYPEPPIIGINGYISDVCFTSVGEFFLGGNFSYAGNTPSASFAIWREPNITGSVRSSLPGVNVLQPVYPNPADETIAIMLSEPVQTVLTFELVDELGRTVRHGSIGSGEVSVRVSVSDLPCGIYSIVTDRHPGARQKVVICR